MRQGLCPRSDFWRRSSQTVRDMAEDNHNRKSHMSFWLVTNSMTLKCIFRNFSDFCQLSHHALLFRSTWFYTAQQCLPRLRFLPPWLTSRHKDAHADCCSILFTIFISSSYMKSSASWSKIEWTRQRALIFPTSQPNATFLGVRTKGAMTPKFELGRDYCTMHLYSPKFHHPMFTRSEVIVLTNKQTDAAENIQHALRCAATLGNKCRAVD